MRLQHRPVARGDLSALFELKVANDQVGQVAPNEVTIAQQAYEPGSYVWGLWNGSQAVGLLAMINPLEYPDLEEDDDKGAGYVWRLMIDEKAQGKGFGREAIAIAAEIARDWGMRRLNLTFVDKPGGAEPFYAAQGFVRTGRIVDGEIEMVRDF